MRSLSPSTRVMGYLFYLFRSSFVSVGSVPKGLSVNNGIAIVTGADMVHVIQNFVKTTTKVKFVPTSSAIHPSGAIVAVGSEVCYF